MCAFILFMLLVAHKGSFCILDFISYSCGRHGTFILGLLPRFHSSMLRWEPVILIFCFPDMVIKLESGLFCICNGMLFQHNLHVVVCNTIFFALTCLHIATNLVFLFETLASICYQAYLCHSVKP